MKARGVSSVVQRKQGSNVFVHAQSEKVWYMVGEEAFFYTHTHTPNSSWFDDGAQCISAYTLYLRTFLCKPPSYFLDFYGAS